MQSKAGFYDEFRRVQTVKRGCKGVEAILDINPITEVRYADFFIDKNEYTFDSLPRFTFNIAKLIQEQIKYLLENSSSEFQDLLQDIRENLEKNGVEDDVITSTINSSKSSVYRHTFNLFKRDIYPSFKDLLWSVLNLFLKPDFQIDIDITNKNYDVFGFKFPNSDAAFLDGNIETAIEEEKDDKDRVHELNQLRKSANRKFPGYVFICLARITIYNKTKPPSETLVTDIDSVVIKISETEFILELNESKNNKKNREKNAKKELKSLLVPVIDANGAGYRIKEVKGFGAKLVIKIKK